MGQHHSIRAEHTGVDGKRLRAAAITKIARMKLLIAFLVLSSAAGAVAEPMVIAVRHAEKEVENGGDPGLSAAGRARAEMLARMLKSAGITHVFTSEFRRTQETAAPVAALLGITPTVVPGKDIAALASKLREINGNALVVGHGDTVPALLRALGIEAPVTIGNNDYGNIFIVALGEKPRLLQLRYP
ncbi:MAG: hypothetical protein DLM52_02650 [Chthoniobacterales bacterium]|nr:MAG: hypothetical protein DLM52_02650 [Chthoniobacterales bacterium]